MIWAFTTFLYQVGSNGAWCVYDWDYSPYLISIHPDEVSAHRWRNRLGYGHVSFVPFGVEFNEVVHYAR